MQKQIIKIISIIISVCFVLTSVGVAFADDEQSATQVDEITTTQSATDEKPLSAKEVQKLLEEQRKELEQKLQDSEQKLLTYQESAKETEEYINLLDEKIGYLNEELNLLDKEIASAQAKVDAYNKQVSSLKKDMTALQERYDTANTELKELNGDFATTYEAYCLRLRAMYISGSGSLIVALLTSKDLAQMLNRYQMIKAIAKSDTKLLKEVKSQVAEINEKKKELDVEKAELDIKNAELTKKQSVCKAEQAKIESKQQEVAEKKIAIAERRAESDALLASYAQKTQQYGEYRNEDEELIASVDQEIDDLLSGLKSPEEATTAVATTGKGNKNEDIGSTTGTLFSKSNAVLSMCYPVPGHRGVSASFGYYSNGKPHSGTDFPCPTGSRVVAAQKGIVIKVRRLNYSYGYYVMVYHGTDKQGRKVVTLYAHNSSIPVSVGQTVTKGQTIAYSGSTGNSTGPHCHFEVILDGTKVNSKNYLG